jgi:hypothetical protein
MIDSIFNLCVALLVSLANLLGISYEAVNIWIFVILWPLGTVALIIIIFWQYNRIRKLNATLRQLQPTITNNR